MLPPLPMNWPDEPPLAVPFEPVPLPAPVPSSSVLPAEHATAPSAIPEAAITATPEKRALRMPSIVHHDAQREGCPRAPHFRASARPRRTGSRRRRPPRRSPRRAASHAVPGVVARARAGSAARRPSPCRRAVILRECVRIDARIVRAGHEEDRRVRGAVLHVVERRVRDRAPGTAPRPSPCRTRSR